MSKKPTGKMTGQEKNALRAELVAKGMSNGDAAAMVNANDRADMVNKLIAKCKTFPKGT